MSTPGPDDPKGTALAIGFALLVVLVFVLLIAQIMGWLGPGDSKFD